MLNYSLLQFSLGAFTRSFFERVLHLRCNFQTELSTYFTTKKNYDRLDF